ncbi:amidase [Caulobacter sp. CCUG 60055]|uniref:creatininase family protein n=1 Tax=Caulobacter sp. CCUG 60055 TaxID=2100090 RepID=UPI001FA7D14A|nr:creatininase family protein [Caulobacter sp. CCUG 60055]MBQ1541670.1 creatininase family protein [Caulobacteraceae bacterium]MCI3182319.1 amidase [Caulobacter sp. CCUG 60055]
MLLAFSTWSEIEAVLRSSQTIVIPIGSCEQHGPTGLLGTDWLCPEIIAHAAATAGNALVAPTFNIGMAQHHLGFAGTISLRPSTFQAAICDWSRSLARHGFRRLYFLNGHGGNIASIEAAFSEFYADASFAGSSSQVLLKLRNWWDLPGVGDLAEMMFPVGHGHHATPSEIAITQAAYPASIKAVSYAPRIAPVGPIHDAADFRSRFADGRVGSDPGLATPELGRRLIDAATASLLDDLSAFENERSGPRGARD